MPSTQAPKQTPVAHATIVLLFALSFWSSGVLFARTLNTYSVWDSSFFTSILFAASVPLAYVCIMGVRRIFKKSSDGGAAVVLHTIVAVVLMHAVALILYPALYTFEASAALSAAAWLLWFGGVAFGVSHVTHHEK